MKLLFIAPFMRIPPDFGLAIRNYHLLNCLAERHAVVLASFENSDQGRFVEWAREQMSEFVSLGSLEWSSSAGYSALLHRVFDYPPSAFFRTRPALVAQQIKLILQRHPDIQAIIFDTHTIAQAALHLKPRDCAIPMIAIFHDVMSMYARRQFSSTGLRPFKLLYWIDWFKTTCYENQISRRFDHIVTMSEPDAGCVRQQNRRARVFVSPNGVDTSFFLPNRQVDHGKREIVFVASFGYPPNVDAFFYLYEQIMPRVWKQIPDVLLNAVGLYPSTAMQQIATVDPRVCVTGAVPDVRPWYARATVAVVPLRVGSGVKLKVVEAFAVGVPVVSTSVGCEGIDARDGEHVYIADTADQFANRIITISQDPDQAQKMARRARQLVQAKYAWNEITAKFEEYLTTMVASPACENHRANVCPSLV